MMKLLQIVAVLAVGAALPVMAASTPAAGPKPPAKVAQVCGACHGVDGVARAPMYPDLAGQYKDYIEQALAEYRNGERVNPIMTPMAKSLTPTQIRTIATWFSEQKPKVYTPDVIKPFIAPAPAKAKTP